MESTLAVRGRQPDPVALAPVTRQMSVAEVVDATRLVAEVMRTVMKEGDHFGTIPGCGPKPTLFKAGAEKLAMTFRLAPSFAIRQTDLGNGHREYEVICTLTHIPSGDVFGQGVGCCSTMESKYRYRGGGRKCPKCQKDRTIIQTKKGRNPGGYWCVPDKGGCGANFNPGDPTIEGQDVGKVENPDIADQHNTVLKMAKKRAQIDATLTACGASDLLTQDLEDLREAAEENPMPAPQAPPRDGAPPTDDISFDGPPREEHTSDESRSVGNGKPRWMAIKAACGEMLAMDRARATEDIKAAAAKAGVKRPSLKDFTHDDYLAINPHLPEMFRVA